MSIMKTFEIIIEKTNTGYSAYAKDYPVVTTGSSMAELKNNITDALNLYFEAAGKIVTVDDRNLKITLDLPQFFEFYQVINAKALSGRIGINQTLLSQYVNGHKKPSQKQLSRIINGIKQLGQELSGLDLNPA
ncbi:helix-turn-helix domain-containing protein [Arcticibacter tournemirensis]|uniref:Type II toxin-antitoxin system HicB family antitoxin n=2 Tax=Arcticibacter tournemirensis TaxID=699437 RepID=A0A5M9GJT3_9SPHI|nr:helix-turn-helix transcriptional regulator [Arcticibacter tournemirensis]KAA8474923.1 type II toxin-antitoxin system HicB family antitoxin [Arcticibacter tournemirensis]